MSPLDNSLAAQLDQERARRIKLASALEQIEALVRAEIQSSVGPPLGSVIYDIQDVLDSLEVKTS